MKLRNPYSVILFTASFLIAFQEGYCTGKPENKDSVLNVLVHHVKAYHPEVVGIDQKQQVKFQSFSYVGYIMNEDSTPAYRVLLSQTAFENDSVDRKIMLFDNEDFIGYYQVKHIVPCKILNFRFLTFNKSTTDFNGNPVACKVNLSKGIPEKFRVAEEECHFIRFSSEEAKDSVQLIKN